MKSTILILFAICFCAFLFAQAPDTMWTKTFGDSMDDWGVSVDQTSEGGYIMAGSTVSYGAGGFDAWLIKTDDNGDTVWKTTYGGSSDDFGRCVLQTTDGGYIITCTKSYGTAEWAVWLIKTDINGNTMWTKTYGHSAAAAEGYSVQQTSDDGFIIAGYIWTYARSLWLIKTDTNGDTLWTSTPLGFDSIVERYANSVQQTSDGGYIIAGWETHGNEGEYPLVVKTDASGDTLWTKKYSVFTGFGIGTSVQQTSDGGYIIAGSAIDFGTNSPFLIKIDANGDTLWTKFYGPLLSIAGSGNSVQQTADGGFVLATGAVTGEYARLMKTDAGGDSLWTRTFFFLGEGSTNSVQKTADGGYILAGNTRFFGVGYQSDAWMIKIAPDVTSIDESPGVSVNDYLLQQNYPNPFNPSTTIEFSLPQSGFITLKVYNILGEEVATLVSEQLTAGKYKYDWDASDLAGGVYLYQIQARDYVEVKKIILMR